MFRRSAVSLAVLTLGGLACADDQRSVGPAISFQVAEAQEPSINVVGYTFTSSGGFITSPPPREKCGATEIKQVPIKDANGNTTGFYDVTTERHCATVLQEGADTTLKGGRVEVYLTYDGETTFLGWVTADFMEQFKTFDIPAGGIVTLQVRLEPGFRFDQWRINYELNEYRSNPYVRGPGGHGITFEAWLIQGSAPGPNPPPDTTSTCIDPSQPSCNPNPEP